MRESHIEKKSKEHARRQGWIARKWTSPGHSGVPDDLFFRAGVLLIVEFKAPGKKPTPLQLREHARLEAEGFPVHVIDDIDEFKRLLDENTV